MNYPYVEDKWSLPRYGNCALCGIWLNQRGCYWVYGPNQVIWVHVDRKECPRAPPKNVCIRCEKPYQQGYYYVCRHCYKVNPE